MSNPTLQPKRVILQQDLPGVIKGTEVLYGRNETYYIQGTLYTWSRGIVEGDDGTWFKLEVVAPLPEQTKEFQWTDSLVQEFALQTKVTGDKNWIIPQMEQFKSSHTAPAPAERPPLGVMPEWRHKELRMLDLDEAIKRYSKAKKPIPLNWISEVYDINNWLENREQEKQKQP